MSSEGVSASQLFCPPVSDARGDDLAGEDPGFLFFSLLPIFALFDASLVDDLAASWVSSPSDASSRASPSGFRCCLLASAS